jgi:tRNA G46 methylase TrmB
MAHQATPEQGNKKDDIDHHRDMDDDNKESIDCDSVEDRGHDDDDDDDDDDQGNDEDQDDIRYNPRKPKWWRKLSRGKPTKGQKRAIKQVMIIGPSSRLQVGPQHGDVVDGRQTSQRQRQTCGGFCGLALPEVPYGQMLDWKKDVFPSQNDCNEDDDIEQELDIWLELGFGRGENLLALLHQKSLHEDDEERNRQQQHQQNRKPSRSVRPFRLVGSEIHSPGIGWLCQRIVQTWAVYDEMTKMKSSFHQTDGLASAASTDAAAACAPAYKINDVYWADYTRYSPSIDPFATEIQKQNFQTTTSEHVSASRSDDPSVYSRRTPYVNLRIHGGDGHKLLSKIPDNSLAAVLVTFPDPFPKDDEKQWRLIQVQTLIEFHRILRPPSKNLSNNDQNLTTSKSYNVDSTSRLEKSNIPPGVFYLATDHDGYDEWSHEIMSRVNNTVSTRPLFEEIPCPDRREFLPAVSTYEQKGWNEGRSTKVSCWRKL